MCRLFVESFNSIVSLSRDVRVVSAYVFKDSIFCESNARENAEFLGKFNAIETPAILARLKEFQASRIVSNLTLVKYCQFFARIFVALASLKKFEATVSR